MHMLSMLNVFKKKVLSKKCVLKNVHIYAHAKCKWNNGFMQFLFALALLGKEGNHCFK